MKLVRDRKLKLIEEVELQLYEEDGKYYIDAEVLHEWLGVKTDFTCWFKRRVDGYNLENEYIKYYCLINNNEIEYKTESDFVSIQQATSKGYKTKYFITVTLLKELINIEKIHKYKKYVMIEKCNEFLNLNNDINISLLRKEDEFVCELEEALKPFNIKGEKQYSVYNYKIDYYIKSLNVAIEYDESNHDYYNKEDEIKREYRIKNKLNCTFIRVNDSKSISYNIGYIIKKIFC